MKPIFVAYINDLRKVYGGLYNGYTKSGSTVIMGEENKKKKEEALEHIRTAMLLLEQIE